MEIYVCDFRKEELTELFCVDLALFFFSIGISLRKSERFSRNIFSFVRFRSD